MGANTERRHATQGGLKSIIRVSPSRLSAALKTVEMHLQRIKLVRAGAEVFKALLVPFFRLRSLSAAAQPERMTGGLFSCSLTSAYNNSCSKCRLAILDR